MADKLTRITPRNLLARRQLHPLMHHCRPSDDMAQWVAMIVHHFSKLYPYLSHTQWSSLYHVVIRKGVHFSLRESLISVAHSSLFRIFCLKERRINLSSVWVRSMVREQDIESVYHNFIWTYPHRPWAPEWNSGCSCTFHRRAHITWVLRMRSKFTGIFSAGSQLPNLTRFGKIPCVL